MCVQLDELHEEAGRILEDLRTVLPERNLRVPDVASAESDKHQDSSDLGSSDKDLEACYKCESVLHVDIRCFSQHAC